MQTVQTWFTFRSVNHSTSIMIGPVSPYLFFLRFTLFKSPTSFPYRYSIVKLFYIYSAPLPYISAPPILAAITAPLALPYTLAPSFTSKLAPAEPASSSLRSGVTSLISLSAAKGNAWAQELGSLKRFQLIIGWSAESGRVCWIPLGPASKGIIPKVGCRCQFRKSLANWSRAVSLNISSMPGKTSWTSSIKTSISLSVIWVLKALCVHSVPLGNSCITSSSWKKNAPTARPKPFIYRCQFLAQVDTVFHWSNTTPSGRFVSIIFKARCCASRSWTPSRTWLRIKLWYASWISYYLKQLEATLLIEIRNYNTYVEDSFNNILTIIVTTCFQQSGQQCPEVAYTWIDQ